MMCKDTGVPPRDDITNLKSLDAIFKTHHLTHLETLNTLWNKVTHRYNHGEDADYIQLILEGLPNISEIMKVLQKWLRNQ